MEMVILAKKVKNIDDEYVDLEVIRYFMNNDVEYLIYSLNEIDESGYTKLYASKIIGSKACIITENDEWNIIKEIIKEIVRCNRDGSELNIIDLDENNLDDIILQDTRVFKLQGNLVNLLSENKKVVEPTIEEMLEEPVEEILEENYEELYKLELEKNKELEKQLDEYKSIIDKIKEIVE